MKTIGKGVLIGLILVAFLFLISHFLQYIDYRAEFRRLDQDISSAEQRYVKRSESWVAYLERRMNINAEAQDSNRVFMTKRLSDIDDRIRKIEKRMDTLEKIIKEEKQ